MQEEIPIRNLAVQDPLRCEHHPAFVERVEPLVHEEEAVGEKEPGNSEAARNLGSLSPSESSQRHGMSVRVTACAGWTRSMGHSRRAPASMLSIHIERNRLGSLPVEASLFGDLSFASTRT